MVRSLFRTIYNLILIIFLSWGILLTFFNVPTAASPVYELRRNHSSDFYLTQSRREERKSLVFYL